MATSGTTTLTLSAKKILMQAMRKAWLLKYDSPQPSQALLAPYLDTLNIIVKQWESFGLHLWKGKRLRVTPVAYRATYKFGTLADAVQEIKFESHAIAAQVSTDTTVDIASDASTDLAANDPIDIYLSDGTIHSTTISGAPAGITGGYRATLTTALDGAMADGARIVTWKTSTGIPVMLKDAYQGSTSSADLIPVEVQHYDDFLETVDPRATGTVQRVALQRTRAGAMLHIYPEPNDATQYLHLDCEMPMEVFSSVDDDPDMPAVWYGALVYELARQMMDDNPDKQYSDAQRLNIIRGAKERLDAAKDMNWEPRRHQLEVDMGTYED